MASVEREHVNLYNPLIDGADCTAATLLAAIAAIGVKEVVLVLTRTDRAKVEQRWTISTNVTIPENITLYVPSGVRVDVGAGSTLTVDGYVRSDEPMWWTGNVLLRQFRWRDEPTYREVLSPFIVSGGRHGVTTGMVSPVFPTLAWLSSGLRLMENAAIDYATMGVPTTGSPRAWVALIPGDVSVVGTFQRVGSTHYYVDSTSDVDPDVGGDGLLLMEVRFTAGDITRVRSLEKIRTAPGERVINAVRDFGMRPIAELEGAAIGLWSDQSPALQAALNFAGTVVLGEKTTLPIVYLPAGTYYLASQVTIPNGVWLRGDGKFVTVLCTNNDFAANGLLYLPLPGNVPSGITGMAVACFNGALAPTAVGINVTANGGMVRDVWVTGFYTGIVLNNSSVFLEDFLAEHCQVGVSITSVHIQVQNGQTHLNAAYGVQVNNGLVGEGGPVLITNVTDIRGNVAGFYLFDAQNVTLNGVTAWSDDQTRFQQGGFVLHGARNCRLQGFDTRVEDLTPGQEYNLGGSGVVVRNNSSNIQISGGYMANFLQGMHVSDSVKVQVTHCVAERNRRHGFLFEGGVHVSVTGNQAFDNGFDQVDDSGFTVRNTATESRHQITGNFASQGLGGPQKYGFHLSNDGPGAEMLFVGNQAQFSATSGYHDSSATQYGSNGIRDLGVESGYWKTLFGYAALSFGTIEPGAAVDQTISVPGASLAGSDVVSLGTPAGASPDLGNPAGLIITAWVSAPGVVKIRAYNATAGSLGVPNANYSVLVYKHTRAD